MKEHRLAALIRLSENLWTSREDECCAWEWSVCYVCNTRRWRYRKKYFGIA